MYGLRHSGAWLLVGSKHPHTVLACCPKPTHGQVQSRRTFKLIGLFSSSLSKLSSLWSQLTKKPASPVPSSETQVVSPERAPLYLYFHTKRIEHSFEANGTVVICAVDLKRADQPSGTFHAHLSPRHPHGYHDEATVGAAVCSFVHEACLAAGEHHDPVLVPIKGSDFPKIMKQILASSQAAPTPPIHPQAISVVPADLGNPVYGASLRQAEVHLQRTLRKYTAQIIASSIDHSHPPHTEPPTCQQDSDSLEPPSLEPTTSPTVQPTPDTPPLPPNLIYHDTKSDPTLHSRHMDVLTMPFPCLGPTPQEKSPEVVQLAEAMQHVPMPKPKPMRMDWSLPYSKKMVQRVKSLKRTAEVGFYFIAVDFEATGFATSMSDIIQVGAVPMDPESGENFSIYISTPKEINSSLAQYIHLDIDAYNRSKVPFTEGLSHFIEWVSMLTLHVSTRTGTFHLPVLVAHNGGTYDWRLLMHQMARSRIPPSCLDEVGIHFADSLKVLRKLRKDQPERFPADNSLHSAAGRPIYKLSLLFKAFYPDRSFTCNHHDPHKKKSLENLLSKHCDCVLYVLLPREPTAVTPPSWL
eukprot:comp20082_c0_seq2/m.24728 comp20082_c0_seq2/g.24728  ORF comp20082_c0_seq2/g.24728 comp20082_c0_seq2/m.24728 type:complete len:580 (-) comp20082_c0_seq2:22-1761(-)